jgi:putative salt-induced outer membrane protein
MDAAVAILLYLEHWGSMMRAARWMVLVTLPWAATAFANGAPPEGVWLGAGQGGLVVFCGNTSATSANAKLDLSRIDGPWKNTIFVGGLYGRTNGIQNGNRIEARYRLDHQVDAQLFWFAGIDGVRDVFSGFAYQAIAAGGVDYRFIATDRTTLACTFGVGYQPLQPQQLLKDAGGAVVQRIDDPASGAAVAATGLEYARAMTQSTKLTDKFNVTSGSEDTAAANDVALAVSMSNRLALSVGYGVRYNTKPAAGVKTLDQVTTINVVYRIG